MDQSVLVKGGKALVRALDQADYAPRFVMWVHNEEINTWKLWLVPPKSEHILDPLEFYRKLVSVMKSCRNKLYGVQAEQVEMVKDDCIAIHGLSKEMRISNLSDVYINRNMFNGYYLPEGILLRNNIEIIDI